MSVKSAGEHFKYRSSKMWYPLVTIDHVRTETPIVQPYGVWAPGQSLMYGRFKPQMD